MKNRVGLHQLGNFFSQDHNGDRWNFETDEQQQQRGLDQAYQYLAADDTNSARRVMTSLGLTTEQQHRIELDQTQYNVDDAAYLAASMLRNNGIDPKTKAGDQRQYTELKARLDQIAQERGRPNSQLDVENVAREFAGVKPIEADWDLTFGRAKAMKGTDIKQERMLQEIISTRNITRQQGIAMTYNPGVESVYNTLKAGQAGALAYRNSASNQQDLALFQYRQRVGQIDASFSRSLNSIPTIVGGTLTAAFGGMHANAPVAAAGSFAASSGLSEYSAGIYDMFHEGPRTRMAFQVFGDETLNRYAGQTQAVAAGIGASLYGPAAAPRVMSAVGNVGSQAYTGLGAQYAFYNGAYSGLQSIAIEQLYRPDVPLFSTQTAITGIVGGAAGVLTHNPHQHWGLTFGINSGANAIGQLVNQTFVDPSQDLSIGQLIATSTIATANSMSRSWAENTLRTPATDGGMGLSQANAFTQSMIFSNSLWLGPTFAASYLPWKLGQ